MKKTIESIKQLPGIVKVQVIDNIICSVFEPVITVHEEAFAQNILLDDELEQLAQRLDTEYPYCIDDIRHMIHSIASVYNVPVQLISAYCLNIFKYALMCNATLSKAASFFFDDKKILNEHAAVVNLSTSEPVSISYTVDNIKLAKEEDEHFEEHKYKRTPDWLETLWSVNPRLAEMAAKDLGYENRR